jgi:hypothetical protein
MRIVSGLGRIGAAGAHHVTERFGMRHSLGNIRLAELTGDGLHEHARRSTAGPASTQRPRRACGRRALVFLCSSPGGFEHAWQMASTAVALYRAKLPRSINRSSSALACHPQARGALPRARSSSTQAPSAPTLGGKHGVGPREPVAHRIGGGRARALLSRI